MNLLAQLAIPTEMAADGVANAGLTAWAPAIAPVLGTVVAVGIVLGLFRLFGGSSRRLGKGG
ncbi:MAG: hypothetical protein AAF668_13955 [Pseudomonadota bacterium]